MDSCCGYRIGDWVYASGVYYGQIVDISNDGVVVEYETFNGGGSAMFGYDEISLAGDIKWPMTNYEKLASDRKLLASILGREEPFWKVLEDWWCSTKCPHKSKCQSGGDCVDQHSDVDLAELWLDEEYREATND